MSDILFPTLEKYVKYISRRKALRKYPLRPHQMYKPGQKYSWFLYHKAFLQIDSSFRSDLVQCLEMIDHHYFTDSCLGFIIEYKGKPLFYFENMKQQDSTLLLHLDWSGLLNEMTIHRKIAEFEVFTERRIKAWTLGLTFALCCLSHSYLFVH